MDLMMKDAEFRYFELTFKEERICFEALKIVEIWMGVELDRQV